MSLIGVDLGTSGVRVAAFDESGIELVSSTAGLTLHRSGSQVELRTEDVLNAVDHCLAEVVSQVPASAISFSTQGEAFVCLAEPESVPVSLDRRGEVVGLEGFQEITGQPVHPMFSIFKMLTMPGPGFETLDSYVARHLGVESPVTDYSMAARTGCWDVNRRSWQADWVRGWDLPEVVAPGTVIGKTRQNVPLVAGAHDQAAAYLGAGGKVGCASAFSLGTSDCLTVGTKSRPKLQLPTGAATYPLADDLWITLAGTAAGGWSLQWLAGLVHSSVSELVETGGDEPSGLLVLPYLAGSGTLDNDPGATGVVVGLTLATTARQLGQGFLEATGYELAKIKDALDHLEPGAVRAVGAGSLDRNSLQVRSNAAGVSLDAVDSMASARGAAFLAGVGLGIYPSLHDLPSVDADTSVHPRNQTWYAQQRQHYADLYQTTRSLVPTFKQNK